MPFKKVTIFKQYGYILLTDVFSDKLPGRKIIKNVSSTFGQTLAIKTIFDQK